MSDRPLLVSDFPATGSFFDHWFSIDSSQWCAFSLDLAQSEAQVAYNESMAGQKLMQNFFVPSEASIRHDFMLELLVTAQTSTVVIGPAGCGRSALLRSTLFGKLFDCNKQLASHHLTMSKRFDATRFKESLEGLLEQGPGGGSEKPKLRPPLGHRLVCYVEDLHMAFTDQHGDQPAVEAIRDYLTEGSWLSTSERRFRGIEGVTFCACLPSEVTGVSERTLRQFALVTLGSSTVESMKDRISGLTELLAAGWASAV